MCSEATRPRLLVVSEQPLDADQWSRFELLYLHFEFTQNPAPDVFSAWAKQNGTEHYWVAEHCRPLAGGFAQQALNRFVARQLLTHKVDALLVVGLYGCTLDLPRMAALMGVPAILQLDAPSVARSAEIDPQTAQCLRDTLQHCLLVACDQPLSAACEKSTLAELPDSLRRRLVEWQAPRQFDYATYEFSQRDPPLLSLIQQPDTRHFDGCRQVLDLACGAGIFLDLLRQRGIDAVGVERDAAIADYGRGMGLTIVTADALEYLADTQQVYDGIYCAHFVEHLPFAQVQVLIERLARRLASGGTLVLVFPDPESIRSQLLGFWRDPEHVRFYHPELVISLARSQGLICDWTSYHEQPHYVEPFALEPPPLDLLQRPPPGWADRLLALLGLASARRVEQLLDQQVRINSQLQKRTDALWAVNRTWAWNDNVALRLKKAP